MKIKTLISHQMKLTERYQRQYQSIVRRALVEEGFKTSETKKKLEDELTRLAARMVKNGIKLGMGWLENGANNET